ncbi:zinc finger, CCHC-type, retrotransposon gag domain protein, partial [Tanacetum coccineum]
KVKKTLGRQKKLGKLQKRLRKRKRQMKMLRRRKAMDDKKVVEEQERKRKAAQDRKNTKDTERLRNEEAKRRKNAEAQSDGCSYKSFLNYKPGEFHGDSDPVIVTNWLREIEDIFEISECSPRQRVKYASHLLKGEARYWKLGHTSKECKAEWVCFKYKSRGHKIIDCPERKPYDTQPRKIMGRVFQLTAKNA